MRGGGVQGNLAAKKASKLIDNAGSLILLKTKSGRLANIYCKRSIKKSERTQDSYNGNQPNQL